MKLFRYVLLILTVIFMINPGKIYALTEQDIISPETSDNIVKYVMILMISIIGIINACLCIKKKIEV